MAKSRLQLIPLGGLGEVGKNMMVVRYDDEIILVDAGLAFPTENMPGIDIVIPDFSYLIENRDKVKAVLITHGHEDHIGALPYLLKEINVPVYGTMLTCGLIEGKLIEAQIPDYKLNVVKAGDEFKLGLFKCGYFHVCHSIPDSCGVFIRTPVGTVVHTGDFKFDHTPKDELQTDLYKLADLGHKGVLALCADSTNAECPGHTPSEAVVAKSLMEQFSLAKGRIIVATFASNVSRLQMAVDAAVMHNRKVCAFGRSMVNVIGKALEMGYLKAPEGTIIEPEEMNRYSEEKICILTTGSQGEPMAGLSRMADGSHRQVTVHAGDTVIISASPIPGNENSVGNTINKLMRMGIKVVTNKSTRVHVSGHASEEDLKTMLSLVKPKFFVPIHGEFRMLYKHAEIANVLGMPKKNAIVAENGSVIELTRHSAKITGKVQAGAIYVDGLGVGDVGNIVLRDRQQLSEDGVVIVVVSFEKGSNRLLAGPDIVTRGFVYVRDSESLLNEAKLKVEKTLNYCENKNIKEWNQIKTQIRDTLGKYFYERTKRRPMILPVIQEIN